MNAAKGRVLHVVGDSKFGGGASVIIQIAEATERDGWVNEVLTTDAAFQQALGEHGIPHVSRNFVRRAIAPHRDLLGLIRFVHYLKEQQFTLIHTHTSKGGVIGRLAGRLARVPLIVHTVHGFAFHDYSHPVALKSYAAIERLAANWCDRIVTVSEFHRDWALQLGIGDATKVMAIPNGIAMDVMTPSRPQAATRELLDVAEEAFLILGVGRLAEQKGFADLIKAVPLVSERLAKPLRVLIAGEGELQERLEALIGSLGLKQDVTLLGFRRDLADLYDAADLVVLPSRWEGLSIALLEAMVAGTPIVTTSIPSNLEVTRDRDCAYIVPPADPRTLADGIVQIAESPELGANLARRASDIVSRYYREETMAEAYVALYATLARQRRS